MNTNLTIEKSNKVYKGLNSFYHVFWNGVWTFGTISNMVYTPIAPMNPYQDDSTWVLNKSELYNAQFN